jgi:N-methylhydantoinase B/oxoprolinase/acetone carboxylase alpha subunit
MLISNHTYTVQIEVINATTPRYSQAAAIKGVSDRHGKVAGGNGPILENTNHGH